jgi:hypothetical protein
MARRLPLLPLAVVIATAGPLLVAGWGGGDDESGSCDPVAREALDSAYLVHVLGTETAVDYTSDPPTSGPHQAGPPVDGVVDDPITRPIQVGILERGDVLLQHDPGLPASELEELRTLAGSGVVVAPNPDLPSPIVATAWTFKQTCDTVDVSVLRDFVADHAGNGPEG